MQFKTRFKPLLQKIIAPVYRRYAARERTYRFQDISVIVKPGVFHPGFFFSTKLLLTYLAKLDLTGKNFLELGAGSGLISVYAAKQGAAVTAADISKTAVENTRQNARRNGVSLTVIESDLFVNIPQQIFDIIAINPPYYPQNPQNESQYAWFCGENFQYFRRLFPQVKSYLNPHSVVILVFSEDCNISEIRRIAGESGFVMEAVFEKKGWWETNYIFRALQISLTAV